MFACPGHSFSFYVSTCKTTAAAAHHSCAVTRNPPMWFRYSSRGSDESLLALGFLLHLIFSCSWIVSISEPSSSADSSAGTKEAQQNVFNSGLENPSSFTPCCSNSGFCVSGHTCGCLSVLIYQCSCTQTIEGRLWWGWGPVCEPGLHPGQWMCCYR